MGVPSARWLSALGWLSAILLALGSAAAYNYLLNLSLAGGAAFERVDVHSRI